MKKLDGAIFMVLLMVSFSIFCQEYKFGKVSKEELLEKSYPTDSSANAAILYEKRKIRIEYNQNDGFRLVTDVFKRIKLYNKEGFDYASEEILLYKRGADQEKVNSIKGLTYTLKNGQVEQTKLKKDGIFKSEFSEYYNQEKFTMPSLEEGSVIEYKYKIYSPFISNIDRIFLQYEIPIKKQHITVASPEYYFYKKFTTGYLPVNLIQSKSQGSINITSRYRAGSGLNGPRTSVESNNITHVVNENRIVSTNVPAFKKEPFSGNSQNYISSITFELSSVNFPNEPIRQRSSTWSQVAKTIFQNSRFGDQLRKTNYYKQDIDQLLVGVSNAEEKAALIYNFVKSKMNWNKRRSVLVRDGVKKAYKENVGNVAEINLMLTSMFVYAGLDADPVIVSTSDRLASLFPTLTGFNYVVSRVNLGDKGVIYLDATDKYGVPNIMPDRVVRGMGRVIAKNGASQRVSFRPSKPSSKRYSMQYEFDKEGSLKGKLRIQYKDYYARRFRSRNSGKKEEDIIKNLENKFGISSIEDYTSTGIKKPAKSVGESFSFEMEEQIEYIEDEIFFSPLLFLREQENVFKSKERKYPIDFGYGFINNYMFNIKVPEGYTVAELPEARAFKLPENMGSFSFKSIFNNGYIQLVVSEAINSSIVTAAHYPAIKEFYNQVIQKENEQVVLKKI